MKTTSTIFSIVVLNGLLFWSSTLKAGTWTDHFDQATLADDWTGNRSFFQIKDGILEGESASPITPSPLNLVELAVDSTDCDVACWINVVAPNTRVCTKGALILRHSGTNGYVFALHEATQTIELYRLANHQMLLKRDAKIDLRKWYYVRAELRGTTMTFFVDGQPIGSLTDTAQGSGSVGVAVQDAEAAWFDDFTVSGPNIKGNVDDVTSPELGIARGDGGQVLLRFQASPPYDYYLQASSTPFSHDWETLATFRAKLQTYPVEFSDPVTNALRFYRLEKIHCGCR
jgi:hypothetical protein